MTMLWRVMLLAALSFGVLIAFPDYTTFAPVTVFIIFLFSCGAMVAATTLMAMTRLNKYFIMNRVFEIIMLIIAAIVLLIFTPQTGGVRPWDKVKQGRYPTESDINRGLSKFGLKDVKHVQSTVGGVARKVGEGLEDAKAVVVKEIGD